MVIAIYCIINQNYSLFAQTFYTIPIGAIIFVIADIFVYFVEFISNDISNLSLKQKFYQIPLCITLLRLKSNLKGH